MESKTGLWARGSQQTWLGNRVPYFADGLEAWAVGSFAEVEALAVCSATPAAAATAHSRAIGLGPLSDVRPRW